MVYPYPESYHPGLKCSEFQVVFFFFGKFHTSLTTPPNPENHGSASVNNYRPHRKYGGR